MLGRVFKIIFACFIEQEVGVLKLIIKEKLSEKKFEKIKEIAKEKYNNNMHIAYIREMKK